MAVIRGLSFQTGVFFIGQDHVACGYHHKNRLHKWCKPISAKTFFEMVYLVTSSLPIWLKLFTLTYFGLILIPKFLPIDFYGLPYYFFIYFAFGTHFIFPSQLKKYHGAEHKVFSDRGRKLVTRIHRIKKAAITNRNCSTNAVVIYFLAVIILMFIGLISNLTVHDSLMYASYIAVLVVPVVIRLMKKRAYMWLRKPILQISYWLQRNWTTSEPDRKHLIAAIESYRQLALVEFPKQLQRQTIKKEKKNMAIVDITIIPIGTVSPSVSEYVSEIHKVLKTYEDKVNYELTPMSTLIEGELPVLFEVIQAIHEVPFTKGCQRVATNIRIDDRRDKSSTLASKLASVQSRMDS